MNKIPLIARAIQTVLTPTAGGTAKKTGFTQRTLVLGWSAPHPPDACGLFA